MDGSQFTNHVVISLKDFMDMSGEIEKLEYEKNDMTRRYNNIKQFVESVHLPADIIADGRLKHTDWLVENNSLDRTVTYKVAVTVFAEDAKKYGY